MPAPPPTILVVEDEVLIRLSIAEYLREQGFNVIEAATADEGRGVFQAGVAIDALFTDVETPGELNGVTLASWVREQHPSVAIVATSGVPRNGALIEANVPGVPFIGKPYGREMVERRLRDALAKR